MLLFGFDSAYYAAGLYNLRMQMCSVRVSNELGARHPRTAKFSVVVVVISSFVIGLFISVILIIFRKQYPAVFSSSEEVQKVVYSLTPLLAACIVINNIQPALSGNLNESLLSEPRTKRSNFVLSFHVRYDCRCGYRSRMASNSCLCEYWVLLHIWNSAGTDFGLYP